jgi:hypothetical protein
MFLRLSDRSSSSSDVVRSAPLVCSCAPAHVLLTYDASGHAANIIMPIDPLFVVTDARLTGHGRGVAQFMHPYFNRRAQNELLTLLEHHGED